MIRRSTGASLIAFWLMTAITTRAAAATLAAGPTENLPGQSCAAVVREGPGSTTDWVGLYRSGASDRSYLSWQYLNASQAPPATPLTSALLFFTLPAAPGAYELRFFAANGFQLLARSNTVSARIIDGPAIGVIEATVDFGALAPGARRDRPIYVANTGTQPFPLAASVTGTGFSLPSSPDGTIPVGGAISILVSYTATGGASETGELVLEGPTRLAVALRGSSVVPPGVEVSASSVLAGRGFTALVRGSSDRTDWVGVAPVGAPDAEYLAWQYLNGTQSPPGAAPSAATLTFGGPICVQCHAGMSRSLELRLFARNGFSRLATSSVISLEIPAPAVTASPARPAPGAAITVSVQTGIAGERHWVGLYAAGAADSQYLDWRYLSGTYEPPQRRLFESSFAMFVPRTAGAYELRLFANNGFSRLAVSAPFTVEAPSPPTLSVSPVVSAGGTFTISVSNGAPGALDWIGLFPASAGDSGYVSWTYVTGSQQPPAPGQTSFTIALPAPLTVGSYELRLFANNGFTRIAAPAALTIVP